ncbi:sirohydrochlorin chelatase [Luteococcus sp. OSA5]|uniref:sirohydrochlorin chelatase n=1 Tax=Luteococcus sp. OSA5 TaxID=3401630 RepID=UPI003B43566B
MSAALVIAAHGTRLGAGVEQCHELLARVRRRLPEHTVEVGYVELVEPPIDRVVERLSATHDRVVVVPLMLGTGAHVRRDIPDATRQGCLRLGGRAVVAEHLSPHSLLLQALDQRIAAACAEPRPWEASTVAVVLAGRGSAVTRANDDHLRLAQRLAGAGWAAVVGCFVQVAAPDVATALDGARSRGARRIVVAPHLLFEGRVNGFLRRDAADWAARHPEVEVRFADVLGPCDELAHVVVQRFREALDRSEEPDQQAPTPSHSWTQQS